MSLFQLNELDWFQRLHSQVHELKRLQQLFETVLDTDLRTHLRVMQLKGNCLIIEAENSAWASRLRFRAPELIKDLRCVPEFNAVTKIDCKTKQSPAPAQSVKYHQPVLSKQSAENIKNMAACIKDPDLKKALTNLATNRKAKT